MAPRRKKAGNQSNEMERFSVGDLVLAKVKGFAAWPAKISRPEDWKRLPDPKKYFVRFFGTSEIGFVAPSNIKTFTIDLKSELIGRPRIKHSKDFARAIDEICQAFEELQGSSSELPEKEVKLPEAPVENDDATGLSVQKEEAKHESVEASADTKLKDEDTNCRSEALVFSNDKSTKDPNDCSEVSRERESLTSPSLSTVSPIKEEPEDSLQEKIVHNCRRKKTVSASESNEKSIKDPNNCLEVSSDRKIPTPPTPSTASPMKEGSGSSLPEEKVVQIRRRKKTVSASESNEKSFKNLNNFPEVSSERKSPTPPSPSTVSSIKEEHGNSLAEEKIVQIHRKKIAVPASESNEKSIKDPNNCPEISKERKSPTPPSPTTVSLIKEEPGDSLLEEKIVQTRRRKKTASASESNEKIIKDPNNCVEVSRERKSPTPSCPSRVSRIKEEPGDSLLEEEISQTRTRKKTVSASESMVQVNKRQRQGDAGYKEVKTLDRRTSKIGGTLHVKEKDAVPIKSMENKKIHLSPSTDLPVSLSKKSPLRTRRRLLRIDDDEIDEEVNPTPVVNENLEDGVMAAISNAPLADSNSQVPAKSSSKSADDSPNQNPCQAEERKPEKTPDKYERRRLSSSLDGSKSDNSAENKTISMVKASTSGSSKTNDVVSKCPNAAVRQKPKLSSSISEKQKEKFQTKDFLPSKGFNLPQDHVNVSVTFKSKFVDSSTSMKDLIAVAQAKRKETHSLGVYQENFTASSLSFHANTIVRERSRSPSLTVNDARSESKEAYGSMSSPDNNEPNNSLTLASEKNEQVNVSGGQKSSDDVEVSVARDAFEAMIETLSRTKESIGRATHQAIECAKLNMASEVVDLLIRKLETEISFRRRIDLFFLVDSITQCSHSRKGIAGASYVPSVQASLSRLLNAAAPPGAAACENRHQCLKVLKLWLERKIFSESVLRPIVDGLEVPGVDPSSGLYLRRQCRSERSIDDPIREMDGMLVDEYGSNVAFQLPGLLSIHDSEVEDDDLPNGLCDDVNVDLVNPLVEEQNIQSETPIKRQQHVLEVDGELEMEELEERKKSRVENSSPPLPSNPPPSPPPLPPSSPPPLPPPPPPHQLSFALPPPTPPPVPYPALQHMPYPPSMYQDHFRTPNSHNPSFVMPGVNAGQLPQVNVGPSEYSHQEVHLPPHGYHSTVQYQPAGQTMVHMPYPPAPVGQTPQSQPPPHHPNLTPQPPPNNYQYPRHNPYFLPPPNPPLQHMSEGHWGSYPGWRPPPSSGAPLVHDGRFNPNLVAPVGSVPVPPAHVGPQVFPYRPDAPPLNCWRPS